ncbi:hypothetical protein UlMin_033772 [Ulmus minor]
MESQSESERNKPVAVFMAFGTKGDVYPVAAFAAGFACDKRDYHVVLVTHSAHEYLSSHLSEKHVTYLPISSPPILSIHQIQNNAGNVEQSFSTQKEMLTKNHRRECYSVIEKIFGQGPTMEDDFIVINFFALEGWSLAELFRVRCIVAAPYVVPYSAPSSYERHFKKEIPLLYKYLQEAPAYKVCWKDVIHWMWPLFTEYWESWRRDLNLSPYPFTDPVTGLPAWHDMPSSPLLLYGFSKEVVEYPDYWPRAVRICGFWFLPVEWQFSCTKCREISALVSAGHLNTKDELCSAHVELQSFLKPSVSEPLVFIGLSSVGSMGFLKDPLAFLHVLQTVFKITSYRFILFTSGYAPLDASIKFIASEASSRGNQIILSEDCISVFNGRLFCFTGLGWLVHLRDCCRVWEFEQCRTLQICVIRGRLWRRLACRCVGVEMSPLGKPC